MLYRVLIGFLITFLTLANLVPSESAAFQCGPANMCLPALVPGCDAPVVPLAPCCEPSPLYPPAPPIVAPVIVAPAPIACAPSFPPPFAGVSPSRPSKLRVSN